MTLRLVGVPGGSRVAWSIAGLVAVLATMLSAGAVRESFTAATTAQAPSFADLPLDFVANRGQSDAAIRFIAYRGTSSARFEQDAFTVYVGGKRPAPLTLRFEGAAQGTAVIGERKRRGVYNFFIGDDPRRWRAGVPAYGALRYEGLYTGIDMRVRQGTGQLEYDLLLEPGARLDRVRIRAEGASALTLDDDGALLVRTPRGTLRQAPPVAWETLPNGEKRPVGSRFRLLDGKRYGFAVTGRDPRNPLVIDPGLEWSTFLGGSGDETVEGLELAPDGSGDVILAGQTWSPDFVHTSGLHTPVGGTPYVARLNSTGSALVYSTFFGGRGNNPVWGLAVDGAGRPVVVGGTNSPDFPTTPGAYDRTGGHALGRNYDAFVIKFNTTGSAVEFGTYLGGSDAAETAEEAVGVDLDPAGSVVVTGSTHSPDFPTTAGAYDRTLNGRDVFVSRLNATGSELTYSTFLGGDTTDDVLDIAVDGQGVVNLTGKVTKFFDQVVDFPTTAGAFDTTFNGGGSPGIDGFFSRLRPDGNGSADLQYSTFLGGAEYKDAVTSVAVDPTNAELVTLSGWTYSRDFPTTPGALLRTHFGPVDTSMAWVARFRFPALGTPVLAWSTFYGSSGNQSADDLVVDDAGAAVIAGASGATNPPTTDGAFDRTPAGADAYVARISADGSRIEYSTLLGGRENDETIQNLAYAGGRSVVVGGLTNSFDFPTTPGAHDNVYGTDGLPSDRSAPGTYANDGFVARLSLEPASADTTAPPAPTLRGPPEGARYTAHAWVTLDWSEVVDASGIEAYHFQVSPNPSFSDDPALIAGTFHEDYVPTSVALVSRSVSNTGTMYWRVRALDGAHNFSAWSSVRTFVVDSPTPPDAPILESPPNNSRFAPGSVTFAWKPAARAKYYHLQVDSESDFRSPVDFEHRTITTTRFAVSIADERRRYWRVRASNDSFTDGPWSTVWQFETKRGEPPPPAPPPESAPSGSVTGEATALAGISGPSGSPELGLIGGGTGQLTVRLNGTAPAGGAVVVLASNDPAVTVPASVTVPAGNQSAAFTVTARSGLHVPVYAFVSAEYGGITYAAYVPVTADDPPADLDMFDGFKVARTSLVGGDPVQATVKLIGAWTAGPGGRIVTLASTNPTLASVPPSVTIPAGSNSTTFTITTHAVTERQTVTILASRGYTAFVTLELLPPGAVTSLTLNPTSIAGGSTSQGTVTVSTPAPAGGTVVALSSHDTNAATVPASVTVPAGSTSATFTVTAKPAGPNGSFAVISASAGGSTKTATLNIFAGGGGGGGTDSVSVTRAEYDGGKRELRVEATSTSSTATLKVYVSSTNELIGTLANNGGGKYSGQFTWSVNPQNVTVKSSLGGSGSRAVTAK